MDVTNHHNLGIVVLIATCNRASQLIDRALASVRNQTHLPAEVVIVNDGKEFDARTTRCITSSVANIPITITQNSGANGAAGAWNSGLASIQERYGDCYVAILDDDDDWDSNHLAGCSITAEKSQADAVVSGLRFWMDEELIERSLLSKLDIGDFLVGNPGWQGSNTFVKLSKLTEAGGFHEGMQSANDRYLAIKLLSLPNFRVAFTGQWTANWRCSTDSPSLSSRGSRSKREGLSLFYSIFGSMMVDRQRDAFFERAQQLFGLDYCDLVSTAEVDS
tara:strand:+ start:5934 stop:6764 length:831 start_codon:yes stop_codon:yes gene_type:complete